MNFVKHFYLKSLILASILMKLLEINCKGIMKVPKSKHGMFNPNFKQSSNNFNEQSFGPYFDIGRKLEI